MNRRPASHQLTLEQLDELIQLYTIPLFIVDQLGFIRSLNREMEILLGCRKQDAVRLSPEELFSSGLSADCMVSDYWKSMLEKGEPPRMRLVSRSGQILNSTYSVQSTAIHGDEHMNIIYLHDYGPAKESGLLQRFSDSFIRDVNLGVILIDMNFRLADISNMACRILGFTRSDVVSRTMEEVFSDVPIDHQLVQRTILDGLTVRNHAFSWTNGEQRYELLMDSNLLRDDFGDIVGAYVIFKDVSNLRSLEEQVQRSDRLAMIGQIAAGTAHEIRNPLTSIKGFLQVLKKTFHESGMNKEHSYTEIMLTEIDRINQLVSEFLLLSKPKNVSFEPIDIPTVLREILPIIHNEAILHGTSVEYVPEINIPKVMGDRELLKQVFLNISKNGIEAMSEGGVLTITERVDQGERKVNIEIHDTGEGIPAFLIDKIFDPFFTTKENGTGLGLSVCQRIIHDLGGSIRVSAKGFGTTFTIGIPYSIDG